MHTTLRLIPLLMLLAGCGMSNQQLISACKSGDWNTIGHDDGVKGDPPNYADRKDFCTDHADKPAAADAAARYQAGWTQGNWDMWHGVGSVDGVEGRLQRYDELASTQAMREHKTPGNQPAYDAGWVEGNSRHWENVGKEEGTAGLPSTQKEANRDKAAAMLLRFDAQAYSNGWRAGNRNFWSDAGMSDARNGLPDAEFRNRAAAARRAGVDVQEESYRAAWNAEIVNYWRNLGTQDATSGKDFAMRSREAKQKGLKIHEQEYRQAWEARLADHWRQAGTDDGYGKPFMLEQRMANAGRDGVFVLASTRELYTRAWEEQNARYCQPENAFERGRGNAGMAVEVCRPELRNQMKHAYVSGQDYAVTEVRYRQAVEEANDLANRVRDARNRLSRLEREIRASQEAKDRPANDETVKQDRRREQDRRELNDHLQRLERQLDDARRWAERHDLQMQRLRREIY